MTVSNLLNREEFMGSDSQDLFNIGFPIVEAGDVRVVVEGPAPDYTKYLLALNTDYQIVNINYIGTFRVQLVNAAQVWLDVDGDLATGYKMCVIRGSVSKQPSDIRNLDRTHLDNVENQFDRLAYILQTHDEKLDRAILLSETESGTLFTRETIRSTERAGGYLSFDASGNVIVAPGTVGGLLVQEGANVVAQRNGTTGQIFRVYKTFTDSANYERLALDCSTTTFQIASEAAGTGVGRQLRLSTTNNQPIEFMISTQRKWRIITSPQTLEPGIDNGFDIGQASTRVRSFYWGTQLLGPTGTAANPAYSFSSATNYGMWLFSGTQMQFAVAGTSKARIVNVEFTVASDMAVAWMDNTATDTGGADVKLVRDAAATLALKNSTTAQTFRVYGTTTGPKYLSLSHDGTDGIVDAQSGILYFKRGGTIHWAITASALIPNASDNTYDIAGSGNRVRNIYFGTQALGPNGTAANPTYAFAGEVNTGFRWISTALTAYAGAGADILGLDGNINTIRLRSTTSLGWSSGADVTSTSDVLLVRDAAAVLALKNGTNAQQFRVYQTTTGTRYTSIEHSGTHTLLNSTCAGDQYFARSGSVYWVMGASTHFYPGTDNGQDNGIAANRWRDGYFGTSVRIGSTTSTTGAIRLANDAAISARDAGNTADGVLIKMDSSNIVRVSEAAGVYVSIMHHSGGRLGFFATTPYARPTYGAPSGGGPTRTTFDTTTVTLAQLAERVRAIIDDMRLYGLFA